MFSPSNFFSGDDQKRFCAPTYLVEGEGARRHVHDLVDPSAPGVVVVDRAFADDPFARSIGGPATVRARVEGEPGSAAVDALLARLPAPPEWVVAVGGGSAIDTAKAVCAHALFGRYRRVGYEELRFAGDGRARGPRLVALPTTAGSGSETSRYFLVKDDRTGEKLVSRAWQVCPEFALLDPELLATAPAPVLVAGAFDAFVHHLETLACAHERSPVARALSVEAVPTILARLDDALAGDRTALSALQRASALGGMAIANVRTGLMHTAGEALAASVDLAHPLTLMVFFAEALASYPAEARARLDRDTGGLDRARAFWEARFLGHGLFARIRGALAGADGRAVVEKVLADTVLVTKEHPAPLGRGDVEALVARALARFEEHA